MPLHLDYRPNSLDKLYGNKEVVASLESVLSRKADFPHTLLFVGPSGCGKTTLARIVAARLGAAEQAIVEMNIADARGIEAARDIRASMHLLPLMGKVKVYILDECQEATGNFQDAMLKPLEEAPAHVFFMLCTTDPQKLKRTIRGRCMTFEVQPLNGPTMRKLLSDVLGAEQYPNFPQDVMQAIIDSAEGSPREALVLLDQVIDIEDIESMRKMASRFRPLSATIKDLCDGLLAKKRWSEMNKIVSTIPTDELERVRRAVLTWCAKVLMQKDHRQAALVIECFSRPFFDSGVAGFVLACYQSVM